jgi:hypothetical protein
VNTEWPLSWPAEWRRDSTTAPVDLTGFTVSENGKPPAGVTVVKGERAGIRSRAEGTAAGPTGAAWVDSNGWRIRLARLRNPDRGIWVETDAPKADEVVPVEKHLVGMADAGAHGGRWVISLDAALRRGLAEKKAEALRDWQRIGAAARFFAQHAAWDAIPARAVLAVVSDFAGENEFLSQEILNLAARQQLPYLLIDKTKLQSVPAGLKAVVYADAQAPSPAVRTALARFVEGGGLLIAGAVWGKADGKPLPESPTVRYSVYPSGQGRLALAREMDDPYLVAADAQVLLSHRNDVMRMWNGGALGSYLTGNGQLTVVHLINYAGRPGTDDLSVWVAGSFRKAAMYDLETKEPKALEILPQRGGAELHLPPVGIYAALELS